MSHESVQARAIFIDAVENVPPERWREYLDEACGADETLRDKVQRLLDAHGAIGSFMDKPAAAPVATIDQPITEKPGTQIGPYKLLQQLGEGGMGVVYMAEQKEPVKRRVALKIIKPGMDTRQVIARFEAERQALAMMDHPNIAKVLDAGQTDSGRPYFVMELVKGVPVTQYCDEQHLTPKERLELFVPICQAVQHAHQKGIIHRDIKPGNILIALFDGQPAPKVIDFGVAKATSQALTERTMFTQLGQVVGTMEYMSPEQAQVNQLDVDTRSDIYSLGVLLYELLTGDTPFDRQRLRSAAFDEMLRIIREEEPPKPSTKLSSSEALPSVAANRHIDPQKLNTLVRGELDWIVMKALEKDRARRYETASRFAEDVRHYLNNEPVVACPPSAGYRFRKFAWRNKAAFSTAAVVAVALLLGIAGTTWQAIQSAAQRDRAVAAEQDARKEAAIAKAINDFLTDDLLSQADPKNEPDRDIKLRTVVDRAAEKLAGRFTGEPLVEAAIRQTLARTYTGLGDYEKAEEHIRGALKIRQRELGPEHVVTLESINGLANVISKLGKYAEAEKLHREVLELRKNALGSDHPSTLVSAGNLAKTMLKLGRHADAEKSLHEVLDARRRVSGSDHPSTLKSAMSLANVMGKLGRHAEAEELHREVLESRRRVLGSDHPSTLASGVNLAGAIERQGRHAEAERLYHEVLVVMQSVLGPEHPDTLKCIHNSAVVTWDQGRYAEAARLFREVLDVQIRVLGPEHPTTLLTTKNLARVCTELSWRLATAEDPAERNAEEAVRFARTATELQPEHANHWDNVGVAQYRAGNWQAAADALEKARQMHGGDDPVHQFFLAMTYWQLERPEDAGREYAEALQWLENVRQSETPYRYPSQDRFREEAEDLMGIDASERKAILQTHLHSSPRERKSSQGEQYPSNE
jgi:serine/threonine protein kinase/Tfp pilus assembly protein PilF